MRWFKSSMVFLLIALTLLTGIVDTPGQVRAQGDGEWPRTVIDGGGNEVVIQSPPIRIASVTLASDEILLPLVGQERFVGSTVMSIDPGISNVASAASLVPNLITAEPELLISLDPDLVIVATWTDAAVVEQLRAAGLTVFMMPLPVGIVPIQDAITLLGQVVGAEESAAEIVTEMQAGLDQVAQAVSAAETPVRVLYLTPGSYTSGAPSTISEAITAAGGVDIAAEAAVSQFDPLSDEFILEQDPDVILLSGWTPWDPTFVEMFRSNPVYEGLSAVQNNHVYVVNDAHLSATSQFIVEGVKDVAALLYPDLYPAYPMTITDAAGNEVTIESRPQRIVSLTLDTSEILVGLLADEPERLVGVVSVIDQPTASPLAESDLLADFSAERIGPTNETQINENYWSEFNTQVLDLQPDLIFTSDYFTNANLGPIRESGIPFVMAGTAENIGDVLDHVAFIGNVVGTRTAAQNVIGQMTDQLEAVAGAVATVEERQTVVYLSPNGDNVWVAGCNTLMDDLIARAGGINAACESGMIEGLANMSMDALQAADPDAIIVAYDDGANWPMTEPAQTLSAVQNNRVLMAQGGTLAGSSQYAAQNVQGIARFLYPELFP